MKKQYIKRYTKDYLFSLDSVEVYKLVLSGKIKKFPSGFWQQNDSRDSAIECIRYLFNDVLRLSDDEIKKVPLYQLFVSNRLSSAIKTCFNWKTFDAFDAAFPNKFKPWEFKCVPTSFWTQEENIINAVKWLLEEKLQLDDEQIKAKFTGCLLEENGLSGMVQSSDRTIFEILDMAYPNKFKPWELKIVPNNYWNSNENRLKALKWLIEEKLNLNDDEIRKKLCSNLFDSNNLGTLLEAFGGSPFRAINTLYPNKFKPWEFKYVPNSFWENENNRIYAVKWLIEEKLQLNDFEVKENISQKVFREHGLGSMLSTYFKGSPYNALNKAYPNKFKPWQFKSVPAKFWNDNDNIRDSIKWLIEEKLQLSDEEIKNKFSHKLLKDNGLDGLYVTSKMNAFELFDIAYPNRLKPWEFKNVPKHYWKDKENVISATRWLIEEKLQIDSSQNIKNISRKDFDDNGLSTITRKYNLKSLVNMAYPNKKFIKNYKK